MKTVICIEGADGSGKSTLSKYIVEKCQSLDWSWEIIGRRANDSSADIGKITSLSQHLDVDAPPQAGFHMRLAREYLRAEQALCSAARIVVLDRFVLSVLSRIRVDGTHPELYIDTIKDIALRSTLDATIYCDCDFEIAWQRVNAEVESGRRTSLSPKERKGATYLRQLHEAIKDDFDHLSWIGQKHSIATDQGLDTMERQCDIVFQQLQQIRYQ